MNDPRFGIGGNKPPLPTAAEIHEQLNFDCAHLVQRRDDLMQAFERFQAEHSIILDDETQGRAADFVKQLHALSQEAEERRKQEKHPYLHGGRAVDGWFTVVTTPLLVAVGQVKKAMTAYADVVNPKVRSQNGALASLRRKWNWSVTDETKIPREYLMPNIGAIDLAIEEGVRDIPGLEIYEETTVGVR